MTWLVNPYRFGAPFICPATLAPPNLYAPSMIAIDLATGCVLYEKDADTVRPTYSIIKLLNALTALDHVPSLATTVAVTSADVTGSPGTQMGLWANDVVSYADLIHGMLLASGNDASKTIARTLGNAIYAAAGNTGAQGVSRFVETMNAKASALGLSTIIATDAGGYTSDEAEDSLSRGSARDLARLIGLSAADTTLLPWLDGGSFNATITGSNARALAVSENSAYASRPGVIAAKTGSIDASGSADDRWNRAFVWQSPSGNRVSIVTLFDNFAAQRDRANDIIRQQLPQDFLHLDPGGTLVPTDDYWSSTKLLIGADAEIGDESGAGHSVTAGGATRVSSPRLLGTHSIQFDGVDDYLECADSDDWAFGNGDFTVELFFRSLTPPSTDEPRQLLIGQWAATGTWAWNLSLFSSGTQLLIGQFSTTGSTISAAAELTNLPAETWNGSTNYAALFRNGSTLGVVLNSSQQTVSVAGTMFNSTAPLRVGRQANGVRAFPGWMDEIRITKGVARLTAAPTIVPARKFPRA